MLVHYNPHNVNHLQVLKVQMVILAIPISNKLAETFIALGVKHVVSFGFESFMKFPTLLPMIHSYIEIFCLRLYGKLFAN